MATISVSGNKKIGTLMKEFNEQFPYLRLAVLYAYDKKTVAKGGTIYNIDISKTIASVRRKDSGGSISISGNKKIKSLEEDFEETFGIFVQVGYTKKDGHWYYTTGASDNYTLSAFNKKCEEDGCKKGAWK